MVMHQLAQEKKYQKIILKSIIFSTILSIAEDKPAIQFTFLLHYNNYYEYNSHFLSSDPLLADSRLSFILSSINYLLNALHLPVLLSIVWKAGRSFFQQKTDYQLTMKSNPCEQIESAVLPSTGLNPAYPLTSQV